MRDEWRVEVDLDDPDHGYTLGERLRSLSLDEEAEERLGGRTIVTRDGSKTVRLYRQRGCAAEAETVVRDLIDEHRLSAKTAVNRYHPVEGAWKDGSIPLPADPEPNRLNTTAGSPRESEQAAKTGEYPWEVRVDLGSLEDAVAVERKLADENLSVERRWRHVLIGQPTEEAAQALAKRLSSELGEAESVSIEAHDVRYPVFMLLGSAT